MGIDIVIILYIIFMVGRRYKQRIEVDHVYPQILQVIHLIQNSLQISPVKIPHVHLGRIPVPVINLFRFVTDIMVFSCKYIVGGISVIKTIHIYLIHDCAFGPGRCGKAGYNTEIIMLFRLLYHASCIIIAFYFS